LGRLALNIYRDNEQAAVYFEKAVELNSNEPKAILALGETYNKLGRKEES
jgi:Flp pilus assembly protein TadD